MNQETSSFVLGALFLIMLPPALYAAARAATAVGDMWSVHLLAPLAPVIGGTVMLVLKPTPGCIFPARPGTVKKAAARPAGKSFGV